jgi:hypothetical protein
LKKPAIFQKGIIVSLFLSVCLFGYGNAGATEVLLLKRGPAPEIIALNGEAKTLYGEFIRRQLKKRYPELKHIVVGDKRYMFITEKWFRDVIDWTDYFINIQVPELAKRDALPIAYEGTFSMVMSNVANIAVAKCYKVKASVLIGLVKARSEKPWGAIKADGALRSYVIGLTEHGSMIYDIRTRQFIYGKDFPNKDYINGIIF